MVNTLEWLPVDVIFEIFSYLSSVEILQSFLSLNNYFSRIIMHDYLWHIHIGDNKMSLSTFKDLCQHVLKLIGHRVISLRITLTNIIGGWSLVSSSLKYNKMISLRRLHLIDIKPHEFDKILNNRLIKQIHTLLVDASERSPLTNQVVEGAYLAKVCSCLPDLTICRLPFDFCPRIRKKLPKSSFPPLMTLPKLSNTNHLHSLVMGINTSTFLQHLLKCIPSIKNLSVGIQDEEINHDNNFDIHTLPTPVDAHLLRQLSRLTLNCIDEISFHRTIELFSSVFGQLIHLSLKLIAYSSVFDPLIISGDTIQKLCIDRLNSLATFALNLTFSISNDMNNKVIYNSFVNAPFTNLQRPKVFIRNDFFISNGYDKYCFVVYTLPYTDTKFGKSIIYEYLQTSCPLHVTNVDLLLRPNELYISNNQYDECLTELGNCGSSLSSLVPWSLIKKITIHGSYSVSAAQLEAILRIAYNVDTLELYDDMGHLTQLIFRNTDQVGIRVNQQIRSLHTIDDTLTMFNVQHFCKLLCSQLSNLKKLSFSIAHSDDNGTWIQSRIVNGENESTIRLVHVMHFLVNHLPQLASLHMFIRYSISSETPFFPHLIRQQLHEWPFSRPYRLQCSSTNIQIWL
ncbi:unnamed protein product [Rotaria sp. Silwood2]|nr:unnamed protein product [Rotaria sp. Silwood2]